MSLLNIPGKSPDLKDKKNNTISIEQEIVLDETNTIINGEKLSIEELKKIVNNNIEYLKWLIKYSDNNDLKLLPSPEGMDTFACSPPQELNHYTENYVFGKIDKKDIPEDLFKAKYFYYYLPRLIEKDKLTLNSLSDHELEHAESSDFSDIFDLIKFAHENKIPVSIFLLFFNGINEDVYVSNKICNRGPARKNGVIKLYTSMVATQLNGEINLKGQAKLTQLSLRILYFYLNSKFPKIYKTQVIINEELEVLFKTKIKENFYKTVNIEIDNSERIEFKNNLYFEILKEIIHDDMEEAKKQFFSEFMISKILEQIMGDDFKDMIEHVKKGKGDFSFEIEVPNELKQKIEKKIQDNIDILKEIASESDNEKGDKINKEIKKMGGEIISEESGTDIDNHLDSLSESDKEKLEKETIKRTNLDNQKKLDKQIPGLKWKEDSTGNILPEIGNTENKQGVNNMAQIKNELDKIEAKKKIKELLEANIDKSEDENELNEILGQIETQIEEPDIKEALKEKVKNRSKIINRKIKRKNKELKKQGFKEGEEDYYDTFLKLEREIEPMVEVFVRSLIDYLPQIKETIFEGNFHSGKVQDIPSAGRKIRMGHYDIYGRREEIDSLKINMGVTLSIDLSTSMRGNKILESLKLLIFLGLFCEKLNIPFYINGFGTNLINFKSFEQSYGEVKGTIMREVANIESRTNIGVAIEDLSEKLDAKKNEDFGKHYLSMIITDGDANEGHTGNALKKIINNLNTNTLVFGLNLDKEETNYVNSYFKKGKNIFLDQFSEIITKGKEELISFFINNKDIIIK